MNRKHFIVLGLLLIIGAVVVQAQTREGLLKKLKGASGELAEKFKSLDKNSDDQLTRDEINTELFDFLNGDGDEKVTLEEAGQALRQKGMEALKQKYKPSETPTRPTAELPPPSKPTTSTESPSSTSSADLKEGPERLVAGEHRVGQLIPNLEMTDIHGRRFKLGDLSHRAVVIAFTNTTCPVCKKYSPTLASLEKAFVGRDVGFIYVNPTASDKIEDIEAAVKAHGFAGKYVRDADGQIAMALGAMKTTDAFVLDAKRTLMYRGAVDDQYGFGYSIESPRRHYLRNAMEATLQGEPLDIPATSAPGCPLNLASATPPAGMAVTYHNRISRLVQNRCLECHRNGGVAPFALTNYQEVSSQSGAILQVIEKGVMPPWFAAAPKEGQTSPFANDCSLSKTEKSDLVAWLKGGMPEGDPSEAPVARVFSTDWQIGKPDQVIQVEKPVQVKADGTMAYQNVFVDTGFTEDKYVKALEVRPTAREVVHHILVFIVDASGKGKRGSRDADDDDEAGGFFAAYAPGYDALVFNEGYGKKIPAGARLKFQIHYTPNGTATEDRPMIGMRFLESEPEHLLDVAAVAQHRLAIPPNADNHKVVATQTLPNDATILAYFPHMHLRGKAFKYEAVLPGGETKTLLDIPRYDFNWQLSYRLAEPISLPKGSTLRAVAWYDNSSKNLANPDPNRTVRWGPQTYDEMMIGYVEYHMDNGSMKGNAALAQLRERLQNGGDMQLLFKRFDTDGNGKLESSEMPPAARDFLIRLDTDKDGAVTPEEAALVRKLIGR